jgi:hypothetical protein
MCCRPEADRGSSWPPRGISGILNNELSVRPVIKWAATPVGAHFINRVGTSAAAAILASA